MPQWGATTTDESKPKDRWLSKGRGDKLANVFATGQGWVMRWPWQDEVLAAIGQLDINLGIPTYVGVELVTASVSNIAPSNVAFRLLFNEGVVVTGTPSLIAISSAASPANITLVYSSAQSDPSAGRLVFANATVSLNTAVAGNGSITYTINSTSTFQGANVADIANANAVSNTLSTFSNVVTVSAYHPGYAAADIKSSANAVHPTTAQTLLVTFNFNEAIASIAANSTAPSIVALSSNASVIANQTLVYNSGASNLTAGNVVFQLTGVNLTGANDIVFTVNSTSTLVGFPLIIGVSGNAAQNTLGGSANTITVAHT